FPEGERARAADRLLMVRGAALPAATRRSIAKETLGVLGDARFAALFAPSSAAEVPIAAVLQSPRKIGPPLRLTGQIDRLAVTAAEVL
ncbi:hypothetical protein ABTB91_19935, partial [Acinetobacter baumannii]